ncbi:hypothetical protein OK016_27435 [Vibrio chagasii]|nr:hypothetical protein [Vibrio chagasii]
MPTKRWRSATIIFRSGSLFGIDLLSALQPYGLKKATKPRRSSKADFRSLEVHMMLSRPDVSKVYSEHLDNIFNCVVLKPSTNGLLYGIDTREPSKRH